MSPRSLPPHQCKIGEVCRRLGKSVTAVRRLVDKGHLKAYWHGQDRVFIRADVEAYALRTAGGAPERATHVAAQMMALGKSDFEILSELDIALEEVERVRALWRADQQMRVSRTTETIAPPTERHDG
jgi:excisionase family DNA binding protein